MVFLNKFCLIFSVVFFALFACVVKGEEKGCDSIYTWWKIEEGWFGISDTIILAQCNCRGNGVYNFLKDGSIYSTPVFNDSIDSLSRIKKFYYDSGMYFLRQGMWRLNSGVLEIEIKGSITNDIHYWYHKKYKVINKIDCKMKLLLIETICHKEIKFSEPYESLGVHWTCYI
ncbi:MAG: hypothetical protein NT150_01050 [Bacteroidetes bacterium]|nr:hypothetical protein [Bacteroidota bacterium]